MLARTNVSLTGLLLVGLLIVAVAPAYGSAFPGSNGKIVFTQGAGSGFQATNRHIYSINPDGTGETDLTRTGAEIYNDEPSVSADGSRIVFVTNRDFAPCCVGQEIYVMNADGTGVQRLTTTTTVQFPDRPTWSPDGRKIAFLRGSQIWTMNADGSAQTQLTNDTTIHDWPSWSPDGASIAFARRNQPGDAGSRIYVMQADGTGAIAVSSNSGTDGFNISWTPDGTQLAFTSSRNGGGEIWTAAADGSGESATALVSVGNPGGANPAWSPDGVLLAFESSGLSTDPEYPKHSIFTIDADGNLASLQRLSHMDSESSPNWGPAGVAAASALRTPSRAPAPSASGANIAQATVKGQAGSAGVSVGRSATAPTRRRSSTARP